MVTSNIVHPNNTIAMSPTSGTMTSTRLISSNKTKVSKPKTSYDRLSMNDLAKLTKTRGLGTDFEIIVRALIEQDKRHAESPFPFMSLPGELRNRIYAEVLKSPTRRGFSHMGMPPLIAVSSQIWKECLSMVLDVDTFGFSSAHRPGTPKTLPGCRCLRSRDIERLEQFHPPILILFGKSRSISG